MKDYQEIAKIARQILDYFMQMQNDCLREAQTNRGFKQQLPEIFDCVKDIKQYSNKNEFIDEAFEVIKITHGMKGVQPKKTHYASIIWPYNNQRINVSSDNLVQLAFLLVVLACRFSKVHFPYKFIETLIRVKGRYNYMLLDIDANELICVALNNEYSDLVPSNIWAEFLSYFDVDPNHQCLRLTGEAGKGLPLINKSTCLRQEWLNVTAIDIAVAEKQVALTHALLGLGAKPTWSTPPYLSESSILSPLADALPETSAIPKQDYCAITPTPLELLDYYGFNSKTVVDSKTLFFYGLYLGIISELCDKRLSKNIILVGIVLQLFLMLLSGTTLSTLAGLATSALLKKHGAFSDRTARLAGIGVSCLIDAASKPLNQTFYEVATRASSVAGDFAGRALVQTGAVGYTFVDNRIVSDKTKLVRLTNAFLTERDNPNSFFFVLPRELFQNCVLPYVLSDRFPNYQTLVESLNSSNSIKLKPRELSIT